MLPLRANNPFAPATYNGLSSIGTDGQGRGYQDKYFCKSFTISLTAFQNLPNQAVQLDKDADFIWEAVSLLTGSPSPAGIRFTDSTGYQLSDQYIGTFSFASTAGIGVPYVLPVSLFMPAGSAILVDFIELVGATPTFQFLFHGNKRFYQ